MKYIRQKGQKQHEGEHFMKRFLSLLCSIMLAASLLYSGPASASENDDGTGVYLKISSNSFGGVTILNATKYDRYDDNFFIINYSNYHNLCYFFIDDSYRNRPVTVIGESAFSYNFNADYIHIPETVVRIEKKAFANSHIMQVDIPDGCTFIGRSAFADCTFLNIATIPESVIEIEPLAFAGCTKIELQFAPKCIYTLMDGVIFHKGTKTLYFYPETLKNNSYTVPSGILAIGESAFKNDNLSEIILPDTLMKIETKAFLACTNLISLSIPASVTEIQANAFPESLSNLTVDPNNPVYEMVDGVLFDKMTHTLVWYPKQKNEQSYNVPDGTIAIMDTAFSGNESLCKIKLPDSLESIGESAFRDCKSLSEVAIPVGISSIPNYAFYGCTSLENVAFPEGLTEVGLCAFSYCALQELALPSSIESVMDLAFSANNFKAVTMSAQIEWNSSVFSECSHLQSVIVESGITLIPFSMFSDCSALTEVILPDGLTKIDAFAFSNCPALKQMIIPASVTEIDSSAFSISYNVNSDITLIVTENSAAEAYAKSQKINCKYINADDWLNN